MNDKGKLSTIQMYQSTKDRLASLGRKDESYEDIILRLLKYYETQ